MNTEPLPQADTVPGGAPAPVGFALGLFTGRFAFSLVHPFPAPRAGEPAAADGDGLDVAAACVDFSKRSLASARVAAGERGSDGVIIGQRGVYAQKLARMAGEILAMEAMTRSAASLAPSARQIEVAMTRIWASERAREHGLETMRIRAARGDAPVAPTSPSARGTNEDQRLGIARAVFAEHWRRIAPALDTPCPAGERFAAAAGALGHYLGWYPGQWLGPFAHPALLFTDLSPRLAAHVRWSARAAHRLARAVFHVLVLHGARWPREELLLCRIVDIGTELHAIVMACSYAQHRHTPEALEVADCFGREARCRVRQNFHALHDHADRAGYRLAQIVLAGRHPWLEDAGRD